MSAGNTWSGHREALAVDSLRQSGRLRMQVRGESMLPTLWPGDEVSVLREPLENIRKGDLVLAIREGRLFLHRFVSHTSDGGFIARGDSVSRADLPYQPNALLGKVVTVNRGGNATWPSAEPRLAQRMVSFSLCHIGVLRRAALYIHSQWKSQSSRENATEVSQTKNSTCP